jgi:hypothetical protein
VDDDEKKQEKDEGSAEVADGEDEDGDRPQGQWQRKAGGQAQSGEMARETAGEGDNTIQCNADSRRHTGTHLRANGVQRHVKLCKQKLTLVLEPTVRVPASHTHARKLISTREWS